MGSVIAVIPVNGRRPLLKWTIRRLIDKNGCSQVICVGLGKEDEKTCRDEGAIWVNEQNKPLGRKWNAGFIKAKEYAPDACLFVGSSDWVSDNWISEMMPHLVKNGMTGTAGCHFGDFQPRMKRLVYWPGYEKGMKIQSRGHERKDEPIGIGRMISSKCLDALKWQPIDNALDNSIDWSMFNRVKQAGFNVKLIKADIHALSISCNLWPNKHKFDDHWRGELPSERIRKADEFLSQHFPEIYNIFP